MTILSTVLYSAAVLFETSEYNQLSDYKLSIGILSVYYLVTVLLSSLYVKAVLVDCVLFLVPYVLVQVYYLPKFRNKVTCLKHITAILFPFLWSLDAA